MAALFFALFASIVVGLGARDQVLVARLSALQGQRPLVLLVAIVTGACAAAAAAWAGAQISGQINGNARLFLVALAVGVAGIELIVLTPRAPLREPTHSLGAFMLVILAAQLTDAARFIVFALAALTRAPEVVAIGGAVGAAAVVVAGWLAFAWAAAPWLTILRRWLGAGLIALALIMGLRAMGYL